MNNFYTIAEVARRLSLSPQTIYKMIKDGILPAIRIGNQWRIAEDQIQAWLDVQATNALPQGGHHE